MLLFLLLLLVLVGLFYFMLISSKSNEVVLTNHAIIISGIIFILTLMIWILFDKSTSQFQFIDNIYYIQIIGIDGISIFFVLLTSLLIFLCFVDSWNYNVILFKNKEFIICFFLLELFLILSFVTLDVLVFYIFFESVLIPMFLIIGIWGSRERKVRADFYFFLYTILGSIFMLFCILTLWFETYSTNFLILQNTFFSIEKEFLLWFLSFIAFSVKIPMFPFHVWLPEAHVEAECTLEIMNFSKIWQK
jgi:NADH-ubiquinone oxidoreductase chain 4